MEYLLYIYVCRDRRDTQMVKERERVKGRG